LWEGAVAGEIHERIRHHLNKQRFGSATSLLAEAKEKFPVFKKLEETDKDDDEEEEDEEVEEGEEAEKNSLEEQFRRIFFMPLFLEIEAGIEEGQVSILRNFFLRRQCCDKKIVILPYQLFKG